MAHHLAVAAHPQAYDHRLPPGGLPIHDVIKGLRRSVAVAPPDVRFVGQVLLIDHFALRRLRLTGCGSCSIRQTTPARRR